MLPSHLTGLWLFKASLPPNLSPCSLYWQNDVTEKEQRWGAKTVAGSGHQEHIKSVLGWLLCSFAPNVMSLLPLTPSDVLLSIHQLREKVSTEHTSLKQQELENMPKASHGYGGKFGVQQDRMDKVD